jgi:hypothetical protein
VYRSQGGGCCVLVWLRDRGQSNADRVNNVRRAVSRGFRNGGRGSGGVFERQNE